MIRYIEKQQDIEAKTSMPTERWITICMVEIIGAERLLFL
jgi:hypothetical protein